jgi:hypothetical protein
MQNYGMYTGEGNKAIHTVVEYAKLMGFDWAKTQNSLFMLCQTGKHPEALDTEVREAVYKACSFDTPFYD